MRPFKRAMSEKLEGRLSGELLTKLPSGFQNIGGIAILSLQPELVPHKMAVAESLLSLLPKLKTVCLKIDSVKGEKRVPSIERLAGNGTEVVHKENGCSYKLDVTKVMFSKGNTRERGRLAPRIGKGEVVVDMFAGIGYFSIPIAKANPGANLYALELNADSVGYLKENIKLNKLKNMEAICCDNRNPPAHLKGVADRVLMGYLPGTDKFLDAAFFFLKPSGGIVHYHDTFKDSELWGKPASLLDATAERHGMKCNVIGKHIVKKYCPRVEHVVVDVEFMPLGLNKK